MTKLDIKLMKENIDILNFGCYYLVMKKKIKIIYAFLAVILIFRVAGKIYVNNFKYSEWNSKKITVYVYDIEKVYEDKIVYNVKYNKDNFLLSVKDTEEKIELGSCVCVYTNNYDITKDNNPYEFDYRLYLNSNNIVSVLYCNKIVEKENKGSIITLIYKLREKNSTRIDESVSKESASLIKNFTYADASQLDENLKEKFRNIGLGHILSVSGTQILFLMNTFNSITNSKKKSILNIFLLSYFYILSLFKLSLFRPIAMYIISYIKPKVSFKKKIIIVFYLLMIINPYYIFNIGIIFSFLSVLSINIFYSVINSWLSTKIQKKDNLVKKIISNISLSISSQILIIPFQIYYFEKLSLFGVISNLCISITITVFMYCIFSFFIFFFIPGISDVVLFLCDKIAKILIVQVDVLYKLNFFNISIPKPNFLAIFSFYLLISIILYQKYITVYFWNNRKRIRKIIKRLKYVCVIYILAWYIYTMYLESYVIYFNVGQGNMALVHHYTKNIIVDIGSTKDNKAQNIMSNFLKAKNITSIDLVIITHMHSDHMNGLEGLIEEENIDIKRVGYTQTYNKVEEEENVKKCLKSNNIGILKLAQGDNLKVGNITIDILTPPKDHYIEDDDMLNANSTVYLISKKNKNYLFMGDSTKKTEKYILDNYIENSSKENITLKLKNIYAYQVSHHGSSSSSYEEYVSTLNIKNAIFSAKKAVYGHPTDEVVEIIKKHSKNIFLTEKKGAIIL